MPGGKKGGKKDINFLLPPPGQNKISDEKEASAPDGKKQKINTNDSPKRLGSDRSFDSVDR